MELYSDHASTLDPDSIPADLRVTQLRPPPPSTISGLYARLDADRVREAELVAKFSALLGHAVRQVVVHYDEDESSARTAETHGWHYSFLHVARYVCAAAMLEAPRRRVSLVLDDDGNVCAVRSSATRHEVFAIGYEDGEITPVLDPCLCQDLVTRAGV